MKILFKLLVLSLLFFGCKDEKLIALQKAQDDIAGNWEIEEVSTKISTKLAPSVFKGGKFTFTPCKVKGIKYENGQFCGGDFILFGSKFNNFFFSNSETGLLELRINIEPPYKAEEYETIFAISGFYEPVINEDVLMLSKVSTDLKPVPAGQFIKLKRVK